MPRKISGYCAVETRGLRRPARYTSVRHALTPLMRYQNVGHGRDEVKRKHVERTPREQTEDKVTVARVLRGDRGTQKRLRKSHDRFSSNGTGT
jgi:hypothetical protein